MSPPRLGGTDEAYLLLESTVGVVAPMQVVVVLDDDPGPDVAQELVERLLGGPLDRAVRRPLIPGARPRWTRPPGSASPRLDPSPVDDVIDWATGHLTDAPIDVVGARGWQVATVAVTGGGRAVSVVASHVLADGRRFVETIARAAAGLGALDAVSPPTDAGLPRRILTDGIDAATAVTDAARAAVRLLRSHSGSDGSAPSRGARQAIATPVDDRPTHHVVTLDRAMWREVARAHGGTATTLLVAVGAGLARRTGVVAARGGADGPVRATLAVDRREEGDSTTANAAGGVALSLDEDPCPATGLDATRGTVRAALAGPPGDDDVARVARLLPSRVLAGVVASIPGPDVAVSHLGVAPQQLLSWRGRRARTVVIRAAARTAAPDVASRMLPGLALWAVEHYDTITLAVCAADPVARTDLDRVVAAELARWGLRVDARSG